MGVADVFEAILARWTAASLGDTVTGGLHFGEAAKGTSVPYAVMTDLGRSVMTRTSKGEDTGTEYGLRQVQIRVHSNAGMSAIGDLADAVRAAFDWATLSLDSGDLLYCRFETDLVIADQAHEAGRIWAATYNVLTADEVNLAPA